MYEMEPIIYRRAQKGPVDFIESTDKNYINHLLYEAGKRENTPKMSIGVLGYRHLEDTKRCVESVLRFAGDIDYELILMDNGSQDGDETLRYYQSVPTMRKKIIQVEDPLGTDYGAFLGTRLMYEYASGDIFAFLGNDNIITENALQNMITCLDSSPDIGLVTPMSSHAFLGQDPGLSYSNFEEMFAAAKAFNRSDPKKWQERMDLAMVATAVKREVLTRSGFYGFWTAEADLCYRIHQAGYKTILLGDTWVCHNHDYSKKKDTYSWQTDADSAYKLEQMNRLELNLAGGLDTLKDLMTFEHSLLSALERPNSVKPKLLAVDVKAGQPLLDMRNKLREYGIFHSTSAVFTSDAKYYNLLSTTANQVYCDRIQFLKEDMGSQKFDVILLGKPINLYCDPENLLREVLSLLEPKGQLLFKVRNCCDVQMLRMLCGEPLQAGQPKRQLFTVEDVKRVISQCSCSTMKIRRQLGNYSDEAIQTVVNALGGLKGINNLQEAVESLLTEDYSCHVR